MTRLLHLVGTRPQYVKLFPLYHHLRQAGDVEQRVYDTGQHYDKAMSQNILDEFGIADVVSGDVRNLSEGPQLARMLENLWREIDDTRPDYALVYGDTNTTAVAALACAKLRIPFGHVEAGVRTAPEVGVQEGINRVVADHLASALFCVNELDASHLRAEGIAAEKVSVVGDLMYDAFARVRRDNLGALRPGLSLDGRPTVLVTLHRAENIDDRANRDR